MMEKKTMRQFNIPMPEALYEAIAAHASERGYKTSTEYARELLARDVGRMDLHLMTLPGAAERARQFAEIVDPLLDEADDTEK